MGGARTRALLVGIVLCVAAAAAVWLGFSASARRLSASIPVRVGGPAITMERPLPNGERTTLAGADANLGATITLPAGGSQLSASNIGAVWVRQDGGQSTSVAVTFPSRGVILQLDRPVSYPQPPAQMYETEASESPSAMSAIDLDGAPALYTAQDTDQLGQNFGAIEFVSDGTRIAVLAHQDLATLRGYAATRRRS